MGVLDVESIRRAQGSKNEELTSLLGQLFHLDDSYHSFRLIRHRIRTWLRKDQRLLGQFASLFKIEPSYLHKNLISIFATSDLEKQKQSLLTFLESLALLRSNNPSELSFQKKDLDGFLHFACEHLKKTDTGRPPSLPEMETNGVLFLRDLHQQYANAFLFQEIPNLERCSLSQLLKLKAFQKHGLLTGHDAQYHPSFYARLAQAIGCNWIFEEPYFSKNDEKIMVQLQDNQPHSPVFYRVTQSGPSYCSLFFPIMFCCSDIPKRASSDWIYPSAVSVLKEGAPSAIVLSNLTEAERKYWLLKQRIGCPEGVYLLLRTQKDHFLNHQGPWFQYNEEIMKVILMLQERIQLFLENEKYCLDYQKKRYEASALARKNLALHPSSQQKWEKAEREHNKYMVLKGCTMLNIVVGDLLGDLYPSSFDLLLIWLYFNQSLEGMENTIPDYSDAEAKQIVAKNNFSLWKEIVVYLEPFIYQHFKDYIPITYFKCTHLAPTLVSGMPHKNVTQECVQLPGIKPEKDPEVELHLDIQEKRKESVDEVFHPIEVEKQHPEAQDIYIEMPKQGTNSNHWEPRTKEQKQREKHTRRIKKIENQKEKRDNKQHVSPPPERALFFPEEIKPFFMQLQVERPQAYNLFEDLFSHAAVLARRLYSAQDIVRIIENQVIPLLQEQGFLALSKRLLPKLKKHQHAAHKDGKQLDKKSLLIIRGFLIPFGLIPPGSMLSTNMDEVSFDYYKKGLTRHGRTIEDSFWIRNYLDLENPN